MNEFSDLWVCQDCMGFLEYGDEWLHEADEARLEEVREAFEGVKGRLAQNWEEGGEGHASFSWHACELCGSHLGGSRYRLAWFDAA